MECRPGCSDLRGLSVLEKLGVEGVGVVVVEDKDVLVPTFRDNRQFSCLVGV